MGSLCFRSVFSLGFFRPSVSSAASAAAQPDGDEQTFRTQVGKLDFYPMSIFAVNRTRNTLSFSHIFSCSSALPRFTRTISHSASDECQASTTTFAVAPNQN